MCMMTLLPVQVEASSARLGIGLVKLMGRQSGFIAVQASMASGRVWITITSEVTVTLDSNSRQFGFVAVQASVASVGYHCCF